MAQGQQESKGIGLLESIKRQGEELFAGGKKDVTRSWLQFQKAITGDEAKKKKLEEERKKVKTQFVEQKAVRQLPTKVYEYNKGLQTWEQDAKGQIAKADITDQERQKYYAQIDKYKQDALKDV